jgi:hypothetical protein
MLLSAWKGTNHGSSKHRTHPSDSPRFCGSSRKVTALSRCRAVNYEGIRSRIPDTSTLPERTLWYQPNVEGQRARLPIRLLPYRGFRRTLAHHSFFEPDIHDRPFHSLMAMDLRVTSNHPRCYSRPSRCGPRSALSCRVCPRRRTTISGSDASICHLCAVAVDWTPDTRRDHWNHR